MESALILIGVLVVCGGLLYLSYRIEPHWVSKDGTRLICYGQGITRDGRPSGRWREMRITKVRDDTVEVRPRRGSLAITTPSGDPIRFGAAMARERHVRRATLWKVAGEQETSVRNRVLYMLDGNDDPSMPQMIAIRVPKTSKARPMLDSLIAARHGRST